MNQEEEPGIFFFYEETTFKIEPESPYINWIRDMISSQKAELNVLNYIFCSDEYLLKINKDYLSHDYYTDIISFPYKEFPDPIQGDIFISIERIKENAGNANVDFHNELKRVMSHGVLHFLGYKDKTGEEKKIMRIKENDMMNLFQD